MVIHQTRADYGIDAPVVVRNLFLSGGVCLALWATHVAGLWRGIVSVGPIGGTMLVFPLSSMGAWASIGLIGMGAWMLWSSKVGKLRDRERLLDHVDWTGDERVLDVGCGRGLMLVGAAKRAPRGRAAGIDIWQAVDLSGNRPAATLENARREGVAEQVSVQTADMRSMPFADGSFDVVVSRFAIHNLATAADRDRAVREIARVLRPGGFVLIDDIRHTRDYSLTLLANEFRGLRDVHSRVATVLLLFLTWGALRPGTIVARKAVP